MNDSTLPPTQRIISVLTSTLPLSQRIILKALSELPKEALMDPNEFRRKDMYTKQVVWGFHTSITHFMMLHILSPFP